MPIKKRGENASVEPDPADSPFDPLKRGDNFKFKRARQLDNTPRPHQPSEAPDGPHVSEKQQVIIDLKKLTILYERAVSQPDNPETMQEYVNYLRKVASRGDDTAASILGAGIAAISVMNQYGARFQGM